MALSTKKRLRLLENRLVRMKRKREKGEIKSKEEKVEKLKKFSERAEEIGGQFDSTYALNVALDHLKKADNLNGSILEFYERYDNWLDKLDSLLVEHPTLRMSVWGKMNILSD